MTIASDARSYADTALDEGKSSLTAAQRRLGSLAGDTHERARNAVDGTRSVTGGVINVSRRQAYAQLGAGDAVLAVITKRSAELPGETKERARDLVEGTRAGILRTAELAGKAPGKFIAVLGEVRDRGNVVARSVSSSPARTRASVQGQVSSRVDQLKDAYLKLGERGEQVAVDLRHDPVVVKVIGDADLQVERAANQLTSIAQKLRARAAQQAKREHAATTSTPVRPTAARQVPAHRTVVRNTPAGAAPISATPIHRAAAHESDVRKAAALKAAETRQERALEREEAAEARSDAAAKAAATRKENAEKAAAKRQAAAAKAAKTRKDKAEAREKAAQARSEAAKNAAATRKHEAEQTTGAQAAGPAATASSKRISANSH